MINAQMAMLPGRRLIDTFEAFKTTQCRGNPNNLTIQTAARQRYVNVVAEMETLLKDALEDETARLFDSRGFLNRQFFHLDDTHITSVRDHLRGQDHLIARLYLFWNPSFCQIAFETHEVVHNGRTVTQFRYPDIKRLIRDHIRPHLKELRAQPVQVAMPQDNYVPPEDNPEWWANLEKSDEEDTLEDFNVVDEESMHSVMAGCDVGMFRLSSHTTVEEVKAWHKEMRKSRRY